MRLLTPLIALLVLIAPSSDAANAEDLAKKFKQLPTVPEAEVPEPSNEKTPFRGIIQHDGFVGHTWAAFPQIENPASLGIDPKGRVFVTEANRFWLGVPDLRGANEMIRDDFKAVTVEDRQKMYDKFASHFPEGWFSKVADRVVRLEDRDGNGAADHRTLFSDRFKEPLDGIGFSILPENDAVYFTCIPNVWKMTDPDDDGVADTHEVIAEGFGVRVSFIGHDLHGMIRGLDGLLYFSVGDRGYHVTTADGKVHEGSGRGAVFRCESDGSGLEVYAMGLRNPQELAFDDYGNLFTFDNTGDIGDKARIVYVLDNTDSGWDMSHQSPHHYRNVLDWGDFCPPKSMWVAEKMFDTFNDEQPQWVYPPAAHASNGPSGVTWLTGAAIPEDLRGQFLLTNYRGASAGSNTLALKMEPSGAGYGLKSNREFIKGVAAADVELGFDGKLYFADFGGGWSVNTNGSIQVLEPRDEALRAEGAKVARLFAEGLGEKSLETVVGLLDHADQRVRKLAQFELVDRGQSGVTQLASTAQDSEASEFARLHAIWGLHQVARQTGAVEEVLKGLLGDSQPEIRANAARVLGDLRENSARDGLLGLLSDESLRVRSLAAVALGRVTESGDSEAVEALYGAAAENGEGEVDPVLRHAYLSALDRIGTEKAAIERVNATSVEERLMAVLFLRRHQSDALTQFLNDENGVVRNEAIRAIYDTKVVDQSSGKALAALDPSALPESLQRRVIAANYRHGQSENAKRILEIASNASLSQGIREYALNGLWMWEAAIETDPVLGHYRPQTIQERSMSELGQEIAAELRGFLTSGQPSQLTAFGMKLGDDMGVVLDPESLRKLASNGELNAEIRVATLNSLAQLGEKGDDGLIRSLLDDSDGSVQAAAIQHAFARDLAGISDRGIEVVLNGPIPAAQTAIAGLATKKPSALTTLWQERETDGLRKELWLDVYLALKESSDTQAQSAASTFAAADPNHVFSLSEGGGNVDRGELVFRNQGACLQCHMVDGAGGIQGPDLSAVGLRLKGYDMVEAIVNPNAVITEGYGMSSVTLSDGSLLIGRVVPKGEDAVTLIAMDNKETEIFRSNITNISPPISPMPPLGAALPPRELRDLVAFLAGQKTVTKARRKSNAEHGESEDEKIAK